MKMKEKRLTLLFNPEIIIRLSWERERERLTLAGSSFFRIINLDPVIFSWIFLSIKINLDLYLYLLYININD
jgi:hypothetical protein